ncbi:putative alkaline phosphatase family protein [Phaeoacremonium minimum UCRPA7]|uniref:Putative alkaline phosphatase family protein n=1 Tax=Phaeoacremonium minimum (strain UCR-PA7) TaxID=1286976 RepID=R8BQ59_PHAM7|nr:putative alkaline phosphatase family protein [Phaeoacremonium minimum UCRPA7]EOO01469.1 putative alkaline phosphatase family protein [Phaeoacremonium minimum UCRPA7]
MTVQTTVAQLSSVALRLVSYFFLRWFLPILAFTLFAIYVPSFISSYLTESKYEVVHDEVDLVIKETTLKGETPEVEDANGDANADDEIIAEEVEVQETIVVGEKPVRGWQSLLTDRLFREHTYTADDLSFVRLGYVSDSEAKLLIREPDQSKMPITVELHIKDPQPPFDNPLWQTAGGIRWTSNETDYTAVLSIPLRHNKQRTYEWRSSNNHSGEFTAAPKAGQTSEITNGQFTFLSTSCIVSRLPYNPLDHPLAIPGMKYLAKALPDLGAQFMLFLGDFIYVDVPRWWGKDIGDYRQKYRQVYASPDWAAVGQNLSWIHVLDDHEISNDWSSNDTGVYKAAVEPWHHYHTSVNPPPPKKAGALARKKPATCNLLPFNDTEKTMLGQEQFEDLLRFLHRPEPKGVKWKVVASSVPFTKNWHVNTKDTWGGFLTERKKLLEAMWDVGSRGYGVVILSGDRHEFAATKFPPPPDSKWPESAAVHEFSASPLSQFYSPIPTYKQTDNEDVKVKYVNIGNSKFGAITIENLSEGEQSSLKYRLFVDGVEAWNTVVLSPQKTIESKASGSFWGRLTGSQ